MSFNLSLLMFFSLPCWMVSDTMRAILLHLFGKEQN